MKRLDQKICLITGAARGIGKAVAELFHQEGSTAIISDINDEEGQQLAKTLAYSTYYNVTKVF